MSQQPINPSGFLIDEDLSPELADIATARGYQSFAVARNTKLRGRADSVIARFALDRELIVVTNNMVDFERIYLRREFHPGLVFMCAETPKLRTKYYQRLMMSTVIDEIEQDILLQEVIQITSFADSEGVAIRLERYFLPEVHQSAAAQVQIGTSRG